MDLLVRLYDLPDPSATYKNVEDQGIEIRRPKPFEKTIVLGWIKENFSGYWYSETDVSFSHTPISSFIAVKDGKVIGFGVYDVTAKGFFGPIGVSEKARGTGIGSAILLKCMYALRECGYAYGIIGGAGPVEFYRKVLGAVPIENSHPGIYKNMLN